MARQTLNGRVDLLEADVSKLMVKANELEKNQQTLMDTSKEILDAVNTAKKVGKWTIPVISSAATAGFLNPKFSAFLMSIFA